VKILTADCVAAMADMEADSIDAIVCDPPYGLGFMGKEWDEASRMASVPPSGTPDTPLGRFNTGKGPAAVAFDGLAFQAWSQAWATQAFRILKPGAHLLAFGGTRTYHRLACAVEDAGFEIRDSLLWLYGSGFPKSLDVSKAIDKAAGAEREVVGPSARHVSGKPEQRTAGLNGSATFAETVGMGAELTAPATPEAQQWQGWGTALKPSHEPIVVGRKPLSGTVAANVLAHGTGALNIDGCRIEGEVPSVPQPAFNSPTGQVYGMKAGEGRNGEMSEASGRWPPNVILSPESAAELDEQSGERVSGWRDTDAASNTTERSIGRFEREYTGNHYGDTGGASRFFYCAKASSAERNAGLRGKLREVHRYGAGIGEGSDPMAPAVERNIHPTVKPLALMRWLVRLVTPPGGTVLDPFTGSGTTGAAAALEGFDFIGIEREAEYAAIAEARCTFWAQFPGGDVDAILESNARAQELEAAGQLGLFGGSNDWG
jgi:site-specific DNA-methyltransferase (adenine-specific)